MNSLKEIKQSTKTYEYQNGFMIDVVETENLYKVYLYHTKFGIKDLMFGLEKTTFRSQKELLDLIETNLQNENYIKNYKENFYY